MTPPLAILFDLDGTLLDSAPDLVATANHLRQVEGFSPLPYEKLRGFASQGAAGLIKAALGISHPDPRFASRREAFLSEYQGNIARHTTVFAGVMELLTTLSQRSLLLGIVTNKMESLTHILLEKIPLPHISCVIGGDTTAQPKPSALPLLEGARRLGVAASACWYVGDDPRDGQAANNAGMPFVAVHYGYSRSDELPRQGMSIKTPLGLLEHLERLNQHRTM